jgi:hypothetical protein
MSHLMYAVIGLYFWCMICAGVAFARARNDGRKLHISFWLILGIGGIALSIILGAVVKDVFFHKDAVLVTHNPFGFPTPTPHAVLR